MTRPVISVSGLSVSSDTPAPDTVESSIPAPSASRYEAPRIERLPDWQVVTLVESIPIH